MRPDIPIILSASFTILVGCIIILILIGLNKALNEKGESDQSRKKKVFITGAVILSWIILISWLSTLNFLNDFSILPPRMSLILLPPLIAVLFIGSRKFLLELLDYVPQHWLIWMHSYRMVIAVIFYFLFMRHIIPVQMTFAGKNYDVLTGVVAPFLGFLAFRKKVPQVILIMWNFLGIVLVSIVVIVAVLSTPYPFSLFHEPVSNTMIAYFPFILMPGFVIPFSFALHSYSLKKSFKQQIHLTKKLNDRWLRIIGIPIVTLLVTLFLHPRSNVKNIDFFFSLIIAAGFTIMLWYGDRIIIVSLRDRFPGYRQTLKRIVFEFSAVALYTILFVSVIDAFLMIYVFHQAPTFSGTLEDILVGMLVSYLMLIVYESIYFFQEWKANIYEVEELKRAQLQNRFDSLKSQVNPHFLFNSLSSLSQLIKEDKSKASSFVQEMSQVYRYILQSNENDLSTIEKEIQFVKSYMYLQRIRFDNHVTEQIEIPVEHLQAKVPSLTLQALMENAVKHNIISASKPLCIRISVDEGKNLVISNNLQKKSQLIQVNSFGLENIKRRFEMHGFFNVMISETHQEFKVTLPLIKEML